MPNCVFFHIWQAEWQARAIGVRTSLQTIRDAAFRTFQVSGDTERAKLQESIDRVVDIVAQTHTDFRLVCEANTQLALHYSLARMQLYENEQVSRIVAGKKFQLHFSLVTTHCNSIWLKIKLFPE
jgi:hypothetical protein